MLKSTGSADAIQDSVSGEIQASKLQKLQKKQLQSKKRCNSNWKQNGFSSAQPGKGRVPSPRAQKGRVEQDHGLTSHRGCGASELCSPRHQGEEEELGEPMLLGHCTWGICTPKQASVTHCWDSFLPSFPFSDSSRFCSLHFLPN